MGRGKGDKRLKGLNRAALIILLTFLTFQPLRIMALAQSPQEPMILSIRESVELALENNLEIALERQNPLIHAMEVEIEKALFDMGLRSTFSRDGTRSLPRKIGIGEKFLIPSVTDAVFRYDLGIERSLSSGGSYNLSLGMTRSSGPLTVSDTDYSSDFSITLTQPLLKGFGSEVTKTPLQVARNNHLVSLEGFESKVVEVVETVEKAYWDLVFQRKNFKVRQEDLRAARELLIQNQAKVELGVLPAIEVLVAEAGVANREEDVVLAEKTVRDAEDRLRQSMNLPDESWLEDRAIIPTSEPVTIEKHFNLKKSIVTALSHPPELKQARIDLENRYLLLYQARNSLKPGLDLQASTGLDGLGDSYGDSLDRLGSRDSYNWQVAMVFNFPLGNRAARSAYRKRQYELERAALTLKKLEQQVVVDLREAIRDVETGIKRMDSVRKARQLAEKKLEAETERFRVGLTTTQNLLDFQQDLAEAQNREVKAITDYNKALVKLGRIQGTLLSERDIHLSDFDIPNRPLPKTNGVKGQGGVFR